jgi:hypothetical protein
MTDRDSAPDTGSAEPAPVRFHVALSMEALLALSLSALLCWNAWPWIAVHSGAPADDTPVDPVAATLAAILLYGLAWPAIAAALMGAQQYAFARLSWRIRLLVSASLLGLVVIALATRLTAAAPPT